MTQVHVVNKNVHTFSQKFKDTNFEIAPGGHVEMDKIEAEEFLGSYTPIRVTADGGHDPRFYKMLEIREIKTKTQAEAKPVETQLNCQACGYKATNEKDLEEHIEANHTDQLVEAEVADKIRKKGK